MDDSGGKRGNVLSGSLSVKRDRTYNILYISNEAELGGAATSLIDMLKELKNKMVNCVVIIPGQGMIEERLQELDVSYYIVNFTRGYGIIGKEKQEDADLNFYNNYSAAIQLQDIIKKENIQLIHINSSVSNVGAFAALMAGIPYVWHFREMMEEDFDCEFWDKPLKMELIHRSNCIISISKTVQESYKRKYNIESVCIYNGVDAERYRGIINWGENQHHNFIITGVISKNKGQWDAVKAIEVLVRKGIRNVHLTLLGSGNGRFVWVMNQYIIQNHLEQYITIVPFQKNLKKYREGNIYAITTSKMEALGRCTIEAMMAGNVVIGADTGGTFEIIGDDKTRGYLYNQGDYENLADVMRQAITDSAETKIKRLVTAQKYAEETFSLENYSNNILEIYQKVLKEDVARDYKVVHKKFLESLEERYQKVRRLDNKAVKEKNSISEIQQKWRELQEKGLSVKDYFIKRNLHNIAVYGMGNLGCQLYNEIGASDDKLKIKYVIDQNDEDIKEYIRVTKPDEILADIDVLVVAVISEEQAIIDHYKDNGYMVISISELLNSFK